MLGTRGIWHEGWFANTVHAASPAGWSNFDKDRWELFHIEADRSQCHDLAAENPDKLEELKALWFSEAEKYNGLPLSDLNILETLSRWRPYLTGTRESYSYYAGTADVGMGASAEIQGRSFVVIAEVTVDTTGAEGVLFKHGGAHGGHVLFIQDGRLHYIYNFLGEEEQALSSPGAVPLGTHTFGVAFTRTGNGRGQSHPPGRRGPLHRRRRGRGQVGRQDPPGHLRPRRSHPERRPQHRIAGVTGIQGPVRVHGWHHCSGERRCFGQAIRECGT